MRVHYSSRAHDWATPPELFKILDDEFHFTLDPCATKASAKCREFYTAAQDGLARSWKGKRVFMNPPYGREIPKWMRKAYEEVRNNGCPLVVCLVPSRTDTRWWHSYCMKGRIRFLQGRVHFIRPNGKSGRAPFPSAIVIFRARRKVRKPPPPST